MTILHAIILGVVQGLTEFLPISSSAHLVFAEHWLGLPADDLTFEIAVHAGTLVAVLVYFRQRLWELLKGPRYRRSPDRTARESFNMILYLVIGSIPAAIVGLLFKDEIERAFASPRLSAAFLIATGLWLLAMRLVTQGSKQINARRAWWIGCAQAVAILPGISRSGSTIATGCMLGVEPSRAAEFSFLLSVPAVFGAILLSVSGDSMAAVGMVHLVGAVVSGLTGYAALRLVFALIRRARFAWFAAYCLAVGIAGVVLL